MIDICLEIPTYWETKKQNEEIVKLNEKDLYVYDIIQILRDDENKTKTEITIENLIEISNGVDLKKRELKTSLYKLWINYKIGYENNRYII